jgi:hypothetical protein
MRYHVIQRQEISHHMLEDVAGLVRSGADALLIFALAPMSAAWQLLATCRATSRLALGR